MCKGVLIVEDNYLLSMLQKRIIERMGHRVVASAKSGSEAIAMVREKEPDIILMDILLDGDMDGIETMKEIRKTSSIPVIYLTGSSQKEYLKRAESIAPVGFLKKPIDQNELKSYIEKALQDQNQSRAS